jgi:polysaccharide export outer membrane protein
MGNSFWKTAASFAVVLLVVGAGTAWAGEYRVGPGDVLEIIVFEETSESGKFIVNPRGELQHTLLGPVVVKDLTADEIRDVLMTKFQRYIRSPKVSVTVVEFNARKVYVFGDVKQPGSYPLKENTTLLQVLITEAGGANGSAGTINILRNYLNAPGESATATSDGAAAKAAAVETIRVDFSQMLGSEGGLSRNVLLEDGDIIYVPSGDAPVAGQTNQVYVFGAVQKPGIYPILNQGYTVLNVVLAAGGFTKFASENRVRLIRKAGDHKEERIVRVGDVMKGQKEKDVTLAPEDVIVVPEGLF